MRFDDITYVLGDIAIVPEKMGIVATDIYDASKTLKYYEESIPEVISAMKLCSRMCNNKDFDNIISERTGIQGFYKKHVHFFILHCEEDTEITYIVKTDGSDNRTWIDGKLKIIGLDQTIYSLKMKAGLSVICIEHAFDTLPYVRLEKVYTPFNKVNPLTKGNYWYRQCDYYIENTNFLFNCEPFTFKLVPIDLVNLTFNDIIQMQIKASDGSVVYEHNQLRFAREYCFDLADIPNMNEDEYECLHVCFKVAGIENTEKKLKLYRFPPNPQYTEKIKAKALMCLEDKKLPDLIHDEIEYCLHVLKSVNNHTYYGRFLKEIITAYSKKTIDEYLYKPGPHNIFYYSDIDANYHYYYVVLPTDYDPNKSYPLILTISHGYIDKYNNKNYSYRFIERPGAIYADIGGVGNNFGSYLGETFIKEEIQHILNHFFIDSKRIYVMGNCGGNWAAYIFLQSHPHMFAGAYTMNARPYMKQIKNLYNINWIHAVATVDESPKDPMQIKRKSIESILRNFNYLFVEKLDNTYLPQAQYTELAMEKLMCKNLIEYPEIIYYRTESNRNRKAYYIEIESIADGKDFAEFNSEIIAYNLVINCKNCTGLKIELPPQIDRRSFAIRINGKSIKFERYYQDVVYLKHTKNKGFIVVYRFDNEITHYKGSGLLDVYLSPMRIINCCLDNAEMSKVANAFAHPVTNTAHPEIYVDYPIYEAGDIVNYKYYALIVIDSNLDVNADLELIRSRLPIQMDKQGYKYKGQFVEGKYCIMQVIANPWASDKSVVYINTNAIDLYRLNLFTRNMIMPTHISGKHPFLNGVALLFDGTKYYSVNEWDENFEVIE